MSGGQPGGFEILAEAGTAERSAAGGAASILDRLKAKTVESLAAQTVELPVPEREGFSVAFTRYMPKEAWEMFGEAHGSRDSYAKAVLMSQCRQVVVDGEPWMGGTGEPLTFASAELWQALGASDGFDAVKRLYLRDGDVWRAAEAVLRSCGWDLVNPLDPTKP